MALLKINILMLAGGLSTRMGSAKHLLPFIGNKPLYMDLVDRLRVACPDVEEILISLRDEEQANRIREDCRHHKIRVILDHEGDVTSEDNLKAIGPAAGLLAAHNSDRHAHWLVVACDYPLLPARALQKLREDYEDPITCFMNDEGWSEPLVALWSPMALRRLHENVAVGMSGPNYTIKSLGAKHIQPEHDWWLMNANTPEEWQAVLRHATNAPSST